MERVYDEPLQGTELFETEIEYWLKDFCIKMNIEDITKETQNRWNAALLHIQKYLFKPNKHLLKSNHVYNNTNLLNNNPCSCNSYDIDKVNSICDMYINLCCLYDKEISILGFEKLTGIPDKTIFDWHYNNRCDHSSIPSSEIYKKLTKEREESLSNMALSGRRNPVGVIAVLNNKCGWAEQKQVIKEERITVAPISREALMAEFGGVIEDKTQDIVDLPNV